MHWTASQKSAAHESHERHATAPVSLAYEPSAHGSQMPVPGRLAAVPTLHGMHADALLLPSTGLAVPGAHVRHQLLLDAPISGL